MGFDQSESEYERPIAIVAMVSAADGEMIEDRKLSL